MGFNHTPSFRDIEMNELATESFQDVRGHQFDVTYDALTNNVIELTCKEPTGHFLTLVRRQRQSDSLVAPWSALKIDLWQGQTDENPAAYREDSIPGLTKFLSDARFDHESGQLTLASQRRNKRWTFRTNGSVELFSKEGHVRLPKIG